MRKNEFLKLLADMTGVDFGLAKVNGEWALYIYKPDPVDGSMTPEPISWSDAMDMVLEN